MLCLSFFYRMLNIILIEEFIFIFSKMQKISLIASNLLYIFLLVNLEFSTVTLNKYTYIEEMCFRFCFFYCFQTFLIDFSLNIK